MKVQGKMHEFQESVQKEPRANLDFYLVLEIKGTGRGGTHL